MRKRALIATLVAGCSDKPGFRVKNGWEKITAVRRPAILPCGNARVHRTRDHRGCGDRLSMAGMVRTAFPLNPDGTLRTEPSGDNAIAAAGKNSYR